MTKETKITLETKGDTHITERFKKLLLEKEVAERLRCEPQHVYNLRHTGKLRYLPGRPVLIDEADLEAYIEEQMRKVYPDDDELKEATNELIRERARQTWIKHHLWKKFRKPKS